MTAAEAKKSKAISKGHVEGILRKLRHTYLKKNEIALDKLRRQLADAQLEDHVDLAAYVTHVEWVTNLMHEQGEPQSTGFKRFALLKGLPTDYALAVQSLQLPQQKDLSWDEIVAYLQDFVEANPTVLGAGPAGPSNTAAESTHATTTTESAHPVTSQEVCKNFSMTGKCVNGDGCGYRHVQQPRNKALGDRPKCKHCGKPGHLEDVCFTKHGRPDWHKEKYPSAGKKPSASPDIKAAVYAVLSQLKSPDAESKHEDHFAFSVEVISAAACAMSQSQAAAGGAATMLDGGSTRHVTFDPADCIDIRACDITVKVGGGTLTCCQQGTRVFRYLKFGKPATCHLLDTLIIPGFGLKIAAEAPFLLKGCSVSKCHGLATISSSTGHKVIDCPINARGLAFLPPSESETPNAKPIGQKTASFRPVAEGATTPANCLPVVEGVRPEAVFQICAPPEAPARVPLPACLSMPAELVFLARAFSESQALYLWHCRLGHRNFNDVAKFLRQAGILFKSPVSPPWCKACVEGKSTRYPLGHKLIPQLAAPRPGYLLHSDCAGPFPVSTRTGKRYFKVLVDDCSRRVFVALLKSLSEAFPVFKDEVRAMEAEFGHDKVVAQFHADGATYFEKSSLMIAFLIQKGITALYSPPDTPELNGIAERTIRTLMEMALCMIRHADAPSFCSVCGLRPQPPPLPQWFDSDAHGLVVAERCALCLQACIRHPHLGVCCLGPRSFQISW